MRCDHGCHCYGSGCSCCGCCGVVAAVGAVAACMCQCLSVYVSLCTYLHKNACACVYLIICITAARSHMSNVFCLVSCFLCAYPLLYLFVHFAVELRKGISNNPLREMSLCASRGCLCIAEAPRMVAFRAVDWTKSRHAQRMAALQ